MRGKVATANPPGLSTGGLHLVDAAGVPTRLEFGRQEGLDARQGGRQVDVFGPETKDVGVVMAAAQAGGVRALVAAMELPMPVVQTRMPNRARPATTSAPTAWA